MSQQTREFRKALEQKDIAIVTDFDAKHSAMLIAFGGRVGGLGIARPPFEFFNLLAGFDVQKMLVRDLKQAWYHQGLVGVAPQIDEVVPKLKAMIEAQNPSRVVMTGSSMGAYAAMMYGCLINVDEVHAFSPQTFVDPALRLLHHDDRWHDEIGNIYRSPKPTRAYFDLRRALERCSYDTVINIYYSKTYRLDAIHARRMAGLPNVALHGHDFEGHAVIKELRNTGELKPLLKRALRLEPTATLEPKQ